MDAQDALTTRISVSPAIMGEPGPGAAELAAILRAGCAAPDHGKLRPWRFLVVRGGARERLGAIFAEALRRRHPEAPQAELEKERARALRAPLVIVVIARTEPQHHKIPEIEQIASTAAAAHSMLLAAHALGYASKWSTGANAYDSYVLAELGCGPNDRLIAFLSFGSLKAQAPPLRRADPAEHAVEWLGPGEERALGA